MDNHQLISKTLSAAARQHLLDSMMSSNFLGGASEAAVIIATVVDHET